MMQKPITRYVWFAVLASLLLIITNLAVWFNRNIFDTAQFTEVTKQAMLSESSRQALAGEIVDEAFKNRPTLKQLIDEQATSVVAGVLNTQTAQRVLDRGIVALQNMITSNNPQPVVLDLSQVRQVIVGVVTLFRQQTDRPPEEFVINVDDIPSQITLLTPDKLPNVYLAGVVLMWLGFLSLLGAIFLLAWPLWKVRHGREDLVRMLGIQAVIVAIGGVVALLLGPLLKPVLLGTIPSPNLRVVVENVYQGFVDQFNTQTIAIFVVAAALALIALGLYVPKLISKAKR